MQVGGPPTHRHMRDFAHHTASHCGFSTAMPTELIGLHDSTFQHGLLGGDVLTGHGDAGIAQQAKGIKIWAREGKLVHVEVFLQMCGFVTSIFGRPRLFLRLQHTPITKPIYTQNSEEPF